MIYLPRAQLGSTQLISDVYSRLFFSKLCSYGKSTTTVAETCPLCMTSVSTRSKAAISRCNYTREAEIEANKLYATAQRRCK